MPSLMIKTLEWLNEQGSSFTYGNGDSTALFAAVEKAHPITDELRDYTENVLPETTLELDAIRVFSPDDIIETTEAIDPNNFLLSMGYLVIGDHDNGVIILNVNDASVHSLDPEELGLDRAEQDEDSEEYFWDGQPIDEVSDDFEMEFDGIATHFSSIEEFDEVLLAVSQSREEPAALGI